MTDYAGFQHGGATFPVTASLANSMLRDVDPAVYFALDFYKAMIETHIGTRLLAEATAISATHITVAVAQTLPFDPVAYLLDQHIKFPLLSMSRKSGEWRMVGQRRAITERIELTYTLPPLDPAEAERLTPALKAVVAIIDARTEQGFDPTYTPPGGSAGDVVWSAPYAGLMKVEVKRVEYGGYQIASDQFFPAIVIQLEMTERTDTVAADFVYLDRASLNIDQVEEDGTSIADVVQTEMNQAPTISSVSPNSGSKAGGTPVTLTGTNFIVGTAPRVLIGGASASNVVVVSATSITCTTPEHTAYPTFAADVRVIAEDGQGATLTTGFSFTTP